MRVFLHRAEKYTISFFSANKSYIEEMPLYTLSPFIIV